MPLHMLHDRRRVKTCRADRDKARISHPRTPLPATTPHPAWQGAMRGHDRRTGWAVWRDQAAGIASRATSGGRNGSVVEARGGASLPARSESEHLADLAARELSEEVEKPRQIGCLEKDAHGVVLGRRGPLLD